MRSKRSICTLTHHEPNTCSDEIQDLCLYVDMISEHNQYPNEIKDLYSHIHEFESLTSLEFENKELSHDGIK